MLSHFLTTAFFLYPVLLSFVHGANHVVMVGGGPLAFNPSTVSAKVGDSVTFMFGKAVSPSDIAFVGLQADLVILEPQRHPIDLRDPLLPDVWRKRL